MIRPLAGVLDLGDGSGRSRALRALPDALLGDDVQVTDAGPLVVAASGRPGGRDGVICIIDGGVYNCDELAGELGLEPGEPPETLLAAGYRRWGSALAPRLRGEFAALIWDQQRGRGLLVPDQLGVRRLFVRADGRRLWFGSEVRNVLALLVTRPAPDPVAISHWLVRSSPPGGATLYEGISGIPWGHLMELDSNGWATCQYWRPKYEDPIQLPRVELVEEIRVALRRAVQRRLTPGHPTGVLMSGGLDSTSIAALAYDAGNDGTIGFAATFPDYPEIDESVWLDSMERAGLPTVRRAARGPGIIATGLEFLLHWELPLHIWGDAWFQPLLNSAHEHGVTTVLGGDGGDEMFGSRIYLIADMMRKGRLLSAARFARRLPEFGGRTPKKVFAELLWHYGFLGVPPASAEAACSRMVRRSSAPWWASDRCARLSRTGQHRWRSASGPRWWAFSTYSVTEGPHAFGLLDHVRRRAEQAGLESRHPLYDVDLCDLMMRVPPEACSDGSLNRPLFREAMAGLSPDAVRLRPNKSRFDRVVIDALTGPEHPILRLLLTNAAGIGDYVNRDAVRELLDYNPAQPREPAGIWASNVIRLAALEVWLRYQEDRSFPQQLLENPSLPGV